MHRILVLAAGIALAAGVFGQTAPTTQSTSEGGRTTGAAGGSTSGSNSASMSSGNATATVNFEEPPAIPTYIILAHVATEGINPFTWHGWTMHFMARAGGNSNRGDSYDEFEGIARKGSEIIHYTIRETNGFDKDGRWAERSISVRVPVKELPPSLQPKN